MTFIKNTLIGVNSYFTALKCINKNGFGVFFSIPILLNILLFLFGMELIGKLSHSCQEFIFQQLNSWFGDISNHEYYKKFIEIFLWIILRIIYLMLFAFFGGYVVMVLMSPLFAYLSEKTESILTNRSYKFKPVKFIKDVFRGIYIASRNLILELLFTLLFAALSFVPVVNLFTPIGLFLVSSFYYGFSFMDYCNERRKPSLKEGILFIRKNNMVAIGNGSVITVVLIIPFVGVIIASMLSIISVVAATIAYLQIDSNRNHPENPVSQPE